MTFVAVVTGPSRGIGRATAIKLAQRGARVALLGLPSDRLERTAYEVSAEGPAARALPCDVTSEADVERAAAQVIEELGVPRVVVNNAGIVLRGPHIAETSVADWDRVIAVNLRGPFLITRALLPAMIPTGRGRLVQVASISATIGSPGAASYAASKWGLVGFTKSLAEELRGTGLQAVAILPGSVDTDMLSGSGFSPAMTAKDVADMIAYAALDAPDSVTGSAIEMFG